MIKIKEAIIVEGKYDKIKLSSIVDTVIIETGGFKIFKDKDNLDLIRRLAETNGIVIITDSDSAGFIIRNYLKGSIPNEKIKNVYIPDIYGKEKRKEKKSKEGKLGVEGVPKEIIIESMKRAGINIENVDKKISDGRIITKMDFYKDGISGKEDSAKKRKELLKYLNMPEHMATNSLIKVINYIMTFDEYTDWVNKYIKNI